MLQSVSYLDQHAIPLCCSGLHLCKGKAVRCPNFFQLLPQAYVNFQVLRTPTLASQKITCPKFAVDNWMSEAVFLFALLRWDPLDIPRLLQRRKRHSPGIAFPFLYNSRPRKVHMAPYHNQVWAARGGCSYAWYMLERWRYLTWDW